VGLLQLEFPTGCQEKSGSHVLNGFLVLNPIGQLGGGGIEAELIQGSQILDVGRDCPFCVRGIPAYLDSIDRGQ
jgi:hypothetical protein